MATHDHSSIRRVDPAEPPTPTEAPPQAVRPGIDQLREILGDVRELLERRRRPFLAGAGGVGALLALLVLAQSSLYESSSLLLVKFGRELVYQPEVGDEQQVIAPRDKQTVINSELAIVRSRPVLDGALRNVGLLSIYPDLGESLAEIKAAGGDPAQQADAEALVYAEASERLLASVSAQALPEADVLRIAYQHTDPIIAAKVVNGLVDSFLEAHLTAFGEPKVASFLEERVAEYQKRLEASEQQLLQFETEHAAFALENPQTALVAWRDAARAELADIETRMASIRLRHLQEDATVSEARNRLLQLQMDATQLEGELLAETRRQIRVVQRFIAARKAEVDEELASLEQKKTELEEKLDVTARELAQLPALSADYRHLRRQRDADEDQYRTYARRLRNARLSTEMDREKIASINVIQPASPSPRAVWPPSKAVTLPVGGVLALLAGGLCAIGVERVGPTGINWLDEEGPTRD